MQPHFSTGGFAPYVAEASAAAALKASCSPPQRKAADALRPAACGTDLGSHIGKPSQNRTSVRKKAAGNPAAFRFLSELLGTRLRHFIICARGTASRLSLGPAGGDSLAPLAGSSSLAILGTERVCNRFYTLLRLLVCADPGHAPKYAKKRRYKTAAFRFLSEPLRGHRAKAFS